VADTLFVPWSENLARTATVEVTAGTEDSTLPATNTVNGNPALGGRINSLQGAIRWSHGSAVDVAVLGLIHHTLDAALACRFEGDDDSAFGSPAYVFNLTIGARDIDGYRNDVFDLENMTPASGTLAATQYQRLVVDAGDNSVNLAFGEIVLGSTRHAIDPVGAQGERRPERIPIIEHPTYAGVSLRYQKGFRTRHLAGKFRVDDTDRQVVLDWFRAGGGRAQPALLVPHHDVNDALLGLIMAEFDESPIYPNTTDIPFSFDELSRGLLW